MEHKRRSEMYKKFLFFPLLARFIIDNIRTNRPVTHDLKPEHYFLYTIY